MGIGEAPHTHTEGLSGRACLNQPPSWSSPATTPRPAQACHLQAAPPTDHPIPRLTPSLDGSEPGCRSLSRSRSAVRAARTLLSELCTVGAGPAIRLPSSLSPSPNLLQLTLTLLGQGPEAALQVGIVWGRQPSGARGVSGLQVARQVRN